jgi:hypothetical protein
VSTGVPLYLVSACGTAEEFVAAFRRYADRAGLFVPTSGPLPAGKRGRIAVTLSDGGVMIEGEAEILQSSPKPTVLQGRPGMTIKFVEPDEPSKLVIAELEKARLAMRPPPPTVPPRPATIPAEPRPVVPPVGGRIDAANALAECIVIGDPSTLRDTAASKSGGAKPFAVPAIPARPNTPSTPPRDKPPTVPPPIPAYPTNTKMTSIGFPVIDKLPASGPTPAPAAPASTGNTGKVSNATTLGMPTIGRKPDPALLNTTPGVQPAPNPTQQMRAENPLLQTQMGTGVVTSTVPSTDSEATSIGEKPQPKPAVAADEEATAVGVVVNKVRPASDDEATSIGEMPQKPPTPGPAAAQKMGKLTMGWDTVPEPESAVPVAAAPASKSGSVAAPAAPATSKSGSVAAPTAPAASKSGSVTAPTASAASKSGSVTAPTAPAASKSGSVAAPAAPAASKSGGVPTKPEPPKPPTTPAFAAAKNHRATSIGFPAMRTPFETQQVGVVPPPKEGDPSAPVVAKKQGMPQQPRGKTPTAPPPGPRYPTPAAPLPVVLMPAKSAPVTDEEEKTDLSSIPIAQLEAKAATTSEEIPETPVPQFDPLEKAAPTGRSGGMRASEIMAAIGGDDWTMTPDASAPTVLEKPAAPAEAASTPGSGPVAKGPPTGNWTISLDPETGWSEPEKVAAPIIPVAPAPAPTPKPKRGAGNPSVAIAGKEAINVVEWEEKPTGIGEAKIEIDATLMEPAKVMPVDESDSGASVMTQEYQPPPLPMPPATPAHSFPASTMMPPHGSGMMPPAGMPQASSQFPTPQPGMFEVGGAPGAVATSKKRWMLIAGSAAVVVVIAVIAILALGGGNKKAKPTAGSNTPPPIAHPTTTPADAADTPQPATGSASPEEQIVETGSAKTETPAPPPVNAPVNPPVAPSGPCKVAVSSVPTGADVLLGKQKLGTTPGSFELPCGTESKLTLKKAKYVATPRSITPSADKSNKLAVKLSRVMFSLKVTSTPAGATITVGGKSAGVTPATVRVAGYETSTIKISKSGFAADTSKVTAKSNGQSHHVTLKRASRR